MSHRGLRRLLVDGDFTHVLLMAGTNDLKRRTATETAESLRLLHGVCRRGLNPRLNSGAFRYSLSLKL